MNINQWIADELSEVELHDLAELFGINQVIEVPPDPDDPDDKGYWRSDYAWRERVRSRTAEVAEIIARTMVRKLKEPDMQQVKIVLDTDSRPQ